jgi:hypothetical protein
MLRGAALVVMLPLAGCSTPSRAPTSTSGSSQVPSSGGSGGPGDAGQGSSACGFGSSPASFTLPSLVNAPAAPFTQLGNSLACAAGTSKLDYVLDDLNADAQPDLVVTSSCDDPTVGVSVWLVYWNSGSGFATTPTRFTLPPQTSAAGCATPSVLDVNGDYYPDYVVTSLCNDATVGTSRWLVYPGSKAGFAQTAVSYPLPPGYSAGAFATTSVATDVCTGGKDVPAFSLFDINGDALVDFVLTQSCSDASIGTTSWQVYPGTAGGASQTSAPFTLPTAPAVTAGAFASTSGSLTCTASVIAPSYALVDFDVDGKIDLVVTEECVDTSVGTTHWLWYRNGGQGFAATAGEIVLPIVTGAPTGSFPSLAAAGKCANGAGAPTYALTDVNGDRTLDLLVTLDCSDPLTGVSYWQVFPNTVSGFTTPPRLLALPPALGATSAAPVGLSGALDCTGTPRPAFTFTYLAGATLGIVATSVCNDTTVGDTRWLFYPASCP